jgi:hypothetical protein
MPIDVTVTGDKTLEAWLEEAPAKLVEGIWKTTEDATVNVLLPAVQADTPVLTGALQSSETADVTRLSTGARGRVISELRYVSFVERGTREHGPARHMFQMGLEQTLTQIQDEYEGMAVKLTESAK